MARLVHHLCDPVIAVGVLVGLLLLAAFILVNLEIVHRIREARREIKRRREQSE